MKNHRGFTIIEFSIVMAVTAVLIAGIMVTRMVFLEQARASRTLDELHSISRAVAGTARRNISINHAANSFTFNNGNADVGIAVDNPVCYNLANHPDSNNTCIRARGPFSPSVLGVNWNGPTNVSNDVNNNSPILDILGWRDDPDGQRLYNGGFNPWCYPYNVCIYPNRTDVMTCVPANERNSGGLSAALDCQTSNCPDSSPVTGDDNFVCVMVSHNNFSRDTSQLRFSYHSSVFENNLIIAP